MYKDIYNFKIIIQTYCSKCILSVSEHRKVSILARFFAPCQDCQVLEWIPGRIPTHPDVLLLSLSLRADVSLPRTPPLSLWPGFSFRLFFGAHFILHNLNI